MTEFNSPLGRMRLAQQAARVAKQQMLTVSDEQSDGAVSTQYDMRQPPPELSNDLESIQAERKAKLQESKTISSVAKDRIDILLGLGRCKGSITIADITFSFQSLKASEIREVVMASSWVATKTEAYFEARNQTLARAIYAIDNQPIELVLGTDDLNSRLEWLGEMSHQVVEMIHDAYLAMLKQNSNNFALKNEEDTKEVAEDIKKS